MQRRNFVQAIGGSTALLTLAGCTSGAGNDDEPGGNSNDGDPGGDSNDGIDVSGSDAIEFSGTGDAVEEGIELEDGLTAIHATHTGSGRFHITLDPENGRFTPFFNVIGEYDGTTAALLGAGTYQLEVIADGEWEVTLMQPRAESGAGLPQSVSGEQDDVFGPFEFDGSHTATLSHSGDDIFDVQVFPPESNGVVSVTTQLGEYEGETTFQHDGVGFVAVKAAGDYSVELE